MACMEIVGCAAVTLISLKILCNIVHFLYTSCIGALLGHNIDLRQHGPWAVVTGATDGIGKAYAQKMAAAGLNVVLVSRTPEKLHKVAEEIKKSTNNAVQVKTISVDFTDGSSIYSRLRTELAKLEIGVLVNNVGMAVGPLEPFADIADEQAIHDIINCNIMSMARMTHIVLPQMIKRNKGIVINIGSLSSANPTPLLTIYGATKAFVDKFSRDLAAEVKSSGVMVQTVHPGFVATNLSKIRRANLFSPSPEVYVNWQLKTLGIESRTAGYWFHKIQLYWMDLANFFAHGFSSKLGLKMLNNIKKKQDKKKKGQ